MKRHRSSMLKLLAASAIGVLTPLTAAPAKAASIFDSGDIAVLRLDYDAGNVSGAAPVFVDVYSSVDGSLTTTYTLPSVGSDALTLSGELDHDGHLNLSSNGQYLVFAGYRADAGADDPTLTAAADTPRVIGVIGADGSIDTSTALTDAYDRTRINAVVSVDGSSFWTAGEGTNVPDPSMPDNEVATTTGGLRYVANLGATTTTNVSQTQSTSDPSGLGPDSDRNARIVDGHIYIDTASHEDFGDRGVYTTSDADPLPTSSAAVFEPVIVNQEGTSTTYDYSGKGKEFPKTDAVFLDLDPTIPGVDTAYGTGGKDKFEKWSLVDIGGGDYEWQPLGTPDANENPAVDTFDIFTPDGDEILALDAVVDSNGYVDLFASTRYGIYRFIDADGYDGVFNNIDTFDTAATNGYFIDAGASEFAGIALLDATSTGTAVPEPTSLALLTLASLTLLRRRHSTRRRRAEA